MTWSIRQGRKSHASIGVGRRRSTSSTMRRRVSGRDSVTMCQPLCLSASSSADMIRPHPPHTRYITDGLRWDREHLNSCQVEYGPQAVEKHTSRWVYSHRPFFAAAYVLDPEFINHDHSSNEEVVEGFYETLEKIAILLKVKIMHYEDPNCFTQLWLARSAAIVADKIPQKSDDNLPSYPDKDDEDVKEFCASVNAQLALYKKRCGIFARTWILDSAKTMPAYLWWDQNGGSTPELQVLARMVLAQPASASICERVNSEFEFVKYRSPPPPPLNKLVGLFHNLRLLKRMKHPNFYEPMVAWGTISRNRT